MKKILFSIFVCMFLLLTACSLANTPTNSVESLLAKYNSNDQEILVELDDYINETDLTIEQSSKYKEIYLKQFKDMSYEIKNETIDGNTAVVTAQITVYDYYKVEKEANEYLKENPEEFKTDGVYDKSLYTDYKLKKYNELTDRTTYTIDFTLTKIDNMWEVNDLNNEQLEKIHGVYAY